jgi:hypothetical protein
MVGRSLALFVPEGERRAFRERLTQLHSQSQQVQVWAMRLQPWRGAGFQAALTTVVVHGPLGHPTAIRWIVEDITAQAEEQSQVSRTVGELLARTVGASSL